jgi:hypothetical protein
MLKMKTTKTFLGLTLILLILGGCSGREAGKTSAKVVLGGIAFGPLTQGGMMIWGRSLTNGQGFSKNVTSSQLSVELPNGTWEFAAITWEGTNGPMTGTARCADPGSFELSGGETNVALNFSIAQCNENVFGAGTLQATSGIWPEVKGVSCGNLFDQALGPDRQARFDGASAGVFTDCLAGSSISPSMRIILPTSNLGGANGFDSFAQEVGLSSACQNLRITGGFASSQAAIVGGVQINMPFMNGNETPFPVVIQYFDNAGCTGTKRNYPFRYGVDFIPGEAELFFASAGQVFGFRGEACGGDRLLPNRYNGGAAASTSEPNPICTVQQLQNIQANITVNKDKNFALLRDLDLSGIADWSPHMIGDATNQYVGDFDGVNRTISNLTINNTSLPFAGLFGELGDSGYIGDLNLNNVNITAGDSINIGGLVGYINSPTTMAEVEGIKVNGVTINVSTGTTTDNVGGLVGRANNVNIEFIRAINITINTNNATNSVGGLIGRLENSSFNNGGGLKISMAENVTIDTLTTTNSQDYGGAVGFVSDSGVYEVAVKNLFMGLENVLAVGGVIGKNISPSNGTDMTLLYSDGSISLERVGAGMANDVGGIVGFMNGNKTGNLGIHKGLASNTSITTIPTGGTIGNTGGIIGKYTFTGTVHNYFVALKNAGNIVCGNGTKCAGLFGSLNDTGAYGTEIYNHIIYGQNLGTVTGNSTNQVGGLVGALKGKIAASSNHGNVSGDGNDLGGLVGQFVAGEVASSYNTGNLTGSGTRVGGIAGAAPAAGSSVLDVVNYGTAAGGANVQDDFGDHGAGDCSGLGDVYSVGTRLCTGVVTAITATEAKATFSGISFLLDDATGITGTASLGSFGNITGLGTGFLSEVVAGENLGLSTDPTTLLGVYDVTTDFSITTNPFNEYRTIAAGAIAKVGPWVYDNTLNKVGLAFETIADLIQPGSVGSFFEPIQISSVTDWEKIYNNTSIMDLSYQLEADIDFGGLDTNLIGTKTYPFTGIFKGNGYTLMNAVINRPSEDNVGLFRAVGKNGRFDSYDFESDIEWGLYLENIDVTGQDNVGALVGYFGDSGDTNGNMNASHIYANSIIVNGNDNVGGLIGHAQYSNGSTGHLKHLSSFNGTITADNNVGGIIGYLQDANATSSDQRIWEHLYNTDSDVDAGVFYGAGGIIGNLAGASGTELKYLFQSGGTVAGDDAIGGLVGGNSGHLILKGSGSESTTITSGVGSGAGGIIGSDTSNTTIIGVYSRFNTINDGGALIGNTPSSSITKSYSVGNTITGGGTHLLGVPGSSTVFSSVADTACGAGCTEITFDQFYEGKGSATLQTDLSSEFDLFFNDVPRVKIIY